MTRCFADYLTRKGLVTFRADLVAMDASNVLEWDVLVEDIKYLSSSNRKVLFVYDGYRIHMFLGALELLILESK